jgi:hypothetical protein
VMCYSFPCVVGVFKMKNSSSLVLFHDYNIAIYFSYLTYYFG